MHPLGIKSKRTSDNAEGSCECVCNGEPSPGMADSRSTRKPIGGKAYAIDHINVLCITSPNTYLSERDVKTSETSDTLCETSL